MSVDDILKHDDEICIFKTEIARGYSNLSVHPADALKFFESIGTIVLSGHLSCFWLVSWKHWLLNGQRFTVIRFAYIDPP